MNTHKILDSEIRDLKIASLPKRPTAKVAYGGEGYTAQEMKAAFDKLPLFIVERFNTLIDDIERQGEGGIGESIKTGISAFHTLAEFFSDVKNGNLASYLIVGDGTLLEAIAALQEEVEKIKTTLGI